MKVAGTGTGNGARCPKRPIFSIPYEVNPQNGNDKKGYIIKTNPPSD